MPQITITRRINAAVDVVWSVLDDYGDIQRWSPSVKRSRLTSAGPTGVGTTRHCDFAFGAAVERIEAYVPDSRLTVRLIEMFKLPMSDAVADLMLTPDGEATELAFTYRFTPNLMGRLLGGVLEKQLSNGLGALVNGLQQESERIAVSEARDELTRDPPRLPARNAGRSAT